MALGEPDRSPLEIWMDRFWRGMYIFFVTIAYLVVFGAIMVPYREVGYFIAPFVAILYWRLVSYWITGKQFELSFDTAPKDTMALFSVIFTVLFALNLVVFYYHLITWYDVR